MTDLSEYTLYSGGHKGAEAAFGNQCEKFGIKEVNFSFEGHKMERTTGIKELDADDLKKGDVSMEIVSARMGRTYSSVNMIRKVIQSIFHMVNSGYQVFAIGWIQADDTVKGGTGWGVELAKLFNRPLSVYDQDKKAWFSWVNNSWEEGAPLISHKRFAGTGTRKLTDDGRNAIDDLFNRSFK